MELIAALNVNLIVVVVATLLTCSGVLLLVLSFRNWHPDELDGKEEVK